MTERWLPVLGHEAEYEVSDLGRVRSKSRLVRCGRGGRGLRLVQSRILRPGRMPSGHMSVTIGKGNSRTVHSLVLEVFVGPAPNGMECLHEDDIPDDNRLIRLRWGTRSENLKAAYANGRRS